MTHVRNRYFFLGDLLLIPLSVYASYVLRLDRLEFGIYSIGFVLFALIAMVVTPLFLRREGLYARYWQYASVGELFLLWRAVMLSSLVTWGASHWTAIMLPQEIIIPRSIPILFMGIATAVLAFSRLGSRLQAQYQRRKHHAPASTPTLVVGAGDAGEMIVRELQRHPQVGMEVVAFLDDDPRKHGMHIHGIPISGDRSRLPQIAKQHHVRQVIIAMPTAPGEVIREVRDMCEQVGVRVRTIPGINELMAGTFHINQLREVKIEDLLRRDPITIDPASVKAVTQGRRVLVTGGGGSIGSELCRQIAQFRPAQLVVLDHNENSLFYIHSELRQRFPELAVYAVIADIRDKARLGRIFENYGPEVIFHAAAHKHVPMMEANPCEAITNNVLGTRNLVELANQYDVDRFVLISTDKAVNPTSVMGAAKRCAELIVRDVARKSGRPYVAVRFGNVLGSNGSVVPTFQQQIANGGPVTVTHKEMTRYFMTIPEAVQLVLQAAAFGVGGEIFLLEMGEPVRIVDLATDLIRLSGLRPDEDIKIKYTGLRPGEKLFEELSLTSEAFDETPHEKISVLKSTVGLSGESALNGRIDRLIACALKNDDFAIPDLLREVVPEYRRENGAVPNPNPFIVVEESHNVKTSRNGSGMGYGAPNP